MQQRIVTLLEIAIGNGYDDGEFRPRPVGVGMRIEDLRIGDEDEMMGSCAFGLLLLELAIGLFASATLQKPRGQWSQQKLTHFSQLFQSQTLTWLV